MLMTDRASALWRSLEEHVDSDLLFGFSSQWMICTRFWLNPACYSNNNNVHVRFDSKTLSPFYFSVWLTCDLCLDATCHSLKTESGFHFTLAASSRTSVRWAEPERGRQEVWNTDAAMTRLPEWHICFARFCKTTVELLCFIHTISAFLQYVSWYIQMMFMSRLSSGGRREISLTPL